MTNLPDNEAILHRLEQLERENARLREKLEPLVGPDNPNFKPREFQRLLQRTILILMIPVWLAVMAVPAVSFLAPKWKMARVGGVPVFSFAGQGGKVTGVGTGLISFGGLAFGAVAIGGMSVGLIVVGGCSIGVVAIGGGSVGIIAIGGGAFGVVAVGGSAVGYFALGQRGHGRYVLALNRQDDRAIAFFRRYVPGLNVALTNPIPVILLEPQQVAAGDVKGPST
jgi:hypothetical protein